MTNTASTQTARKRLGIAAQEQIIDLLWDSLKRDPEHADRRQTGCGTKTKGGLCACLERIFEDNAS